MDEYTTVLDLSVDHQQWTKTGLLDPKGRQIYWRRPVGFHSPDKEYIIDSSEKPQEAKETG